MDSWPIECVAIWALFLLHMRQLEECLLTLSVPKTSNVTAAPAQRYLEKKIMLLQICNTHSQSARISVIHDSISLPPPTQLDNIESLTQAFIAAIFIKQDWCDVLYQSIDITAPTKLQHFSNKQKQAFTDSSPPVDAIHLHPLCRLHRASVGENLGLNISLSMKKQHKNESLFIGRVTFWFYTATFFKVNKLHFLMKRNFSCSIDSIYQAQFIA